MQKIASPQELQAELKAIMAFVHSSEKPDRQVVAAKIRELANRVVGRQIGVTKLIPSVERAERTLKELKAACTRFDKAGPSQWRLNSPSVLSTLNTVKSHLSDIEEDVMDVLYKPAR